jgi:hypothetical protein
MSAKQFLNGHIPDPGCALINLGEAMVCRIPELTTLARGKTRLVGTLRKNIARGFPTLYGFIPWILAQFLVTLFTRTPAVVTNKITYNP